MQYYYNCWPHGPAVVSSYRILVCHTGEITTTRPVILFLSWQAAHSPYLYHIWTELTTTFNGNNLGVIMLPVRWMLKRSPATSSCPAALCIVGVGCPLSNPTLILIICPPDGPEARISWVSLWATCTQHASSQPSFAIRTSLRLPGHEWPLDRLCCCQLERRSPWFHGSRSRY